MLFETLKSSGKSFDLGWNRTRGTGVRVCSADHSATRHFLFQKCFKIYTIRIELLTIAIRGFAVSIGQCAIGHFAWNKRHDSRFFDAVVGQRVEFLPAVDELRGGVFVRQDDGTSAKLTPFCKCQRQY